MIYQASVKAFWVKLMDRNFFFQFFKGSCHGKILGKIDKMTSIWQASIPEWLGICQLRFKNIQVCKYDKDWSSNPGDYEGNKCTLFMRRQKSAYPTKYFGNYYTDLHQLFSFGIHMYGDYKTKISFAVAQGTLLW